MCLKNEGGDALPPSIWEQGAGGSNPLTPTTFTATPSPPLCSICARQHRGARPKTQEFPFRVGRSRGSGGTQGTRGQRNFRWAKGQTSRLAPEWIVRLDCRVANNPRANGDRRGPAGRCRVLGAPIRGPPPV